MKLKITHKEINPIQHELEIEFGWDEVEQRIPDVLKEFTKNSTIKGFRKGTAPENVVRAHVGEKRIHERAAEKATCQCMGSVEPKKETGTLEGVSMSRTMYDAGAVWLIN